MHLRYRFVLPLVAICLALAVAPALAAKSVPTLTPTQPSGPAHQVGTIQTTPTCQAGVLPPAVGAFGYILPPNDAYYTLILPNSACGPCPGGAYLLTAAHVQLYWTEACQVVLNLSIVGATEQYPGCLGPNPFDIKCLPTTYTLNDAGSLNACNDYVLPLPAACCVNGPVFLAIEFNQSSCPPNRPAFCYPGSCTNCTQYNIYPGSPPQGDDLCQVLSPFGIYGVIMYVDATCCVPVPTLPGSWGKMKTLYR
jgi:hypothetical protein